MKLNHWRWWVVGVKMGKKWLLGGYFTEEEADEKAWDFFQELPYSKHYLNTVNRVAAGQKLRHIALEDGEDFEDISSQFSHH